MAFSLLEKRSGITRNFSTRDLLDLIGDRINDEIILKEEVYRISSCQELSIPSEPGLPSGVDWVTHELIVEENGQRIFGQNEPIADTDAIFLTVNSVLYQYGTNRDFHLHEQQIHWHGGFELEPSDRVVLRYPVAITEEPDGPETAPDAPDLEGQGQ